MNNGVSPPILAFSRAVSISYGKYLIPFRLMDSFSFPQMFKFPSASIKALSPVTNQPSSVNEAAVAVVR